MRPLQQPMQWPGGRLPNRPAQSAAVLQLGHQASAFVPGLFGSSDPVGSLGRQGWLCVKQVSHVFATDPDAHDSLKFQV